jgi:hypothetical protein
MPNPFPNPDLRDFRFVSLLPSLCYGQNIMIATVDGQSGKPLQRITVPLYASDIELYPTADGIALQGEAKPPHTKPFNSPWHLAFRSLCLFLRTGTSVGSPAVRSRKRRRSTTHIALKSGIVSDNSDCDPRALLTGCRYPGRIVSFAKKLTAWERFKAFFHWRRCLLAGHPEFTNY